jgi:hypothetical protein
MATRSNKTLAQQYGPQLPLGRDTTRPIGDSVSKSTDSDRNAALATSSTVRVVAHRYPPTLPDWGESATLEMRNPFFSTLLGPRASDHPGRRQQRTGEVQLAAV